MFLVGQLGMLVKISVKRLLPTSNPRQILDDTAAELLGLDNSAAIRALVENLGTGGDARAQVITLALVLGSMEARTPKGAWRSGSSAFMSCVTPGEYLKWLAVQGYPLSPGEEVITGDRTADAVYDEQSSADGKE